MDSTEFKEEGETVSKHEQDHELTENQKETEEWMRPRGRNAAIWSHFKESKNDREEGKADVRVKCNHCPSIFTHSSSTSNYLRHMKFNHPSIGIQRRGNRDSNPLSLHL